MERHPKPVPMTPRIHLFPYRTQKLSLVVPKILGWRRPGKIGRCRLFSLITARWSSGQDGGLSRRKREFDSPTGHQKKGRKNRGPYAPLAQLVEQLTLNQRAQGSSPWRCTKQKSQSKRTGFFVWRTLPRLSARRIHRSRLCRRSDSSRRDTRPKKPAADRFFLTASTGGALHAPAPAAAAVLFNNGSVIFSSNDVRCSPH